MSTTHGDFHVEVRQYPHQDYPGADFDDPLPAVGESVAAAYGRIFAHLAGEHVQPAGPPAGDRSGDRPGGSSGTGGLPDRGGLADRVTWPHQ